MSSHSNSTDVVCPQPGNSLLLLESLIDKANEVATSCPAKVITSLLSTLSQTKTLFDTQLEDSGCKVTQHYLTVLGKYLAQGLELVDEWMEKGKGRKDQLRILVSKLNVLVELFDSAVHIDPFDLFCLDTSHPRWELVLKLTQEIHSDDYESLTEDIEHIASKLAISDASLNDSRAYNHRTMKKLQVGAGAIYYLLFRDAAIKKARMYHSNPDVESTKAMWSLVDSRLVSPLYQSLIVSIHLNTVIYVPRTAPHFFELRSRPKSDFLSHTGKHYIEQLQEEPINHLVGFSQSIDPDKRRIPVRLLCPFELPLSDRARDDRRSWFNMCCEAREEGIRDVRRLILHIHGGGFIAMSSNSHQNYTRRWARDTLTPVLSIDYRLSPESRYPDALDDCWQVYTWLREYSKKYLGISPDKIIIAGDSAGGNLAMGVTLRCIKSFGKIPDGLLLAYPAVLLDVKRYTPSLAFAIEDSNLHYWRLKMLHESYLSPGDDPTTNPFLSPLLTERCDLEQYPPVRMLVCGNDPHLDNCFRMVDRLIEAEVDVKVAKFEGMIHGALNFDLATGIKDARQLVNKGSEFLKELFEMQC